MKKIAIAPHFYVVNPPDTHCPSYRPEYGPDRFIFWLGAYGSTMLLVYSDHLEDALDEMIDWCVDFATSMLCDDQVDEEFARLYDEYIATGMSEEDASEKAASEAEVDTTQGGNCGHYLLSQEWGIVCENPTRQELLEIIANK